MKKLERFLKWDLTQTSSGAPLMHPVKKNQFMKDTVRAAALTMLASLLISGAAWAQGSSSSDRNEEANEMHRGWAYNHHERGGREGFIMGVCVGQTLAQQGVTIPNPEPGKRPELNQAQRDAMKSATESCRASMSGRGTLITPTAAPAPIVTLAPTAAPSP